MKTTRCILGIDFGTTSLSAVIIDLENKQILKIFNYTTDAYIIFSDPGRKEQSIQKLSILLNRILDSVESLSGIQIESIGFTGQMHGILGVDKTGKAVTNLVTWQDKSSQFLLPDGMTLIEKLQTVTGKVIADGYGILALYKWIQVENRTDIASFCTIADYFAHQITGQAKICMHAGNAHSIGLFDLESSDWDTENIRKIGLPVELFPKILEAGSIIGYYKNIPVACAIGDNQASYLGSVGKKRDTLLLNIGTGTQLSCLVTKEEVPGYLNYVNGYDSQIRPFNSEYYLLALGYTNGGSVYKTLFCFFRETGKTLFNLEEFPEDVLWENMERAGRDCMDAPDPLNIYPLLEGTRMDTSIRGSIQNLSSSNFRPGYLIAGILSGLATYFKNAFFPELPEKGKLFYGSGNGLKRNKLFCEIIENVFDCPLILTHYEEEAAVGAALHSCQAIGLLITPEEEDAFLSGLSLQKNQ